MRFWWSGKGPVEFLERWRPGLRMHSCATRLHPSLARHPLAFRRNVFLLRKHPRKAVRNGRELWGMAPHAKEATS